MDAQGAATAKGSGRVQAAPHGMLQCTHAEETQGSGWRRRTTPFPNMYPVAGASGGAIRRP